MLTSPSSVVIRHLLADLGLDGDGMTDGDLLACFVRSRDEDALAALVRRHASMVWGVCHRHLSHHDAEDAFQAAFLVLVHKAADVPGHAVANWLYGVARMTAVRLRATATKRGLRERQVFNMPEPTMPEVPDAELPRVVDEELTRLPDHYRGVIVLCELEGMTRKEAARQLRIPEGSVASRLSRARAMLAKRLKQRGVVLSGSTAVILSAGTASGSAPLALVAYTCKAASLLASGQASGVVSAKVAALTAGVLKIMTVNKLKIAIGMVVSAVALTTLTYGMVLAGQPDQSGNDNGPANPPKVDQYGDPLPDGAVARLGTLQYRRAGGFGAASVVSPDGKNFLEIDHSLGLRSYDAASGKFQKITLLSGEQPHKSHFSRNGRVLIGEDVNKHRTVTAWNSESGKQIGKWTAPAPFWIGQTAISADGKMVAIMTQGANGSPPAKVFIWEPENNTERSFNHATHRSMLFSPDGSRLFILARSGVTAWDTATGKNLWDCTESADGYTFHVAPDGKSLLFWHDDNPSTMLRVDAASGIPIASDTWPEGMSEGDQIDCLPDGRVLISTLSRETPIGAFVWDPATGKKTLSIPEMSLGLQVFPDGKSAVGTYKGNCELQRWDLATGKTLWPDKRDLGHAGQIRLLAFDPSGKRLATLGADETVRLWDIASRDLVRTILIPELRFGVLSFTPDGKQLLVSDDGELVQLDADSGKEVRRLPILVSKRQSEQPSIMVSCRVTADGSQILGLVTGAILDERANSVSAFGYDFRSGEQLFFRDRNTSGTDAGQSHDGSLTVSIEGKIVETRTGRFLRDLSVQQGVSYGQWTRPCFTFSADNRVVATGVTRIRTTKERYDTSFEGVQVWDVVTGEPLAHANSGLGGCIALSPDGRTLATADMKSLRGWDVFTGEQVWKYALDRMPKVDYAMSFAGHIEFSPDGRSIAAAMADSTVLLWDVPAPRRKPVTLASATDQKAAWDALISSKESKSIATAWALADAGEDAVTLLRDHLKPITPVPEERIRRYIADLDDTVFAKRDVAARELAKLGEQCEPAFRAALESKISQEQRKRIESLLSETGNTQAERVRFLRAVQALEAIGTPSARTLLEDLAKGDPAAKETKAATSALLRLARR